ncbi:MAG: helix-turn-helix domain-containing protein [Methanothrix sp.]|jgi:hypothetical protein|nr:helix-turn-helix domain-containing protein [Methanothrix sp.]
MIENLLFYNKELINEILFMYLNGASVIEISDYFGFSEIEVNKIIDRYSKYL